MSYDKQTWQTGEVITAQKLNHMEDGIAESGSGSGGVLMIHSTLTSDGENDIFTLDKTAAEIIQAFSVNGQLPVVVFYEDDDYYFEYLGMHYIVPAMPGIVSEDEYHFVFRELDPSVEPKSYRTTSINGYPVCTLSNDNA